MGILFRYIFREVLVSSLVGALLFTFVLFLRQVGPIMELLVGPSSSYTEVLHLILLALPQTLRFTIPMGVLVGVLVGLGRLSTDGEITAMRAAGIPSRRVALPIFVFALLGALLCALTTLSLNPRAQRELNAITETLKISQATAEIPPRVFIERFPNVVLYVRDVVPGATVRWQGVFLADMRPPQDRGSVSGVRSSVDGPAVTVAEEAVAVPRPEQSRIQLHLSRATRYEQSSDPDDYYFQGFGQTDQVLEIARSGLTLSSRPFDHMDTAELVRAAHSGEHAIQAAIELQQRWSFPVACLVFPLAGIPLAITSQRSGRSVGVVFSVVLAFAYWMIWLAGVALAIDGILPVVPAVWMANVVFAAGGLFLLWQLDAPNRRDMAAALLGRARDFIAGMRSGPPPPAWSPDELPDGRERRRRPRTNVADAQTPAPLIRIMDRYVLRTFLNYLALLVATFVLIWCVFSFFELLTDMLARQKLGLFIPYIYYLTPFLVYETTPLGVLVATLVCFGILAKHHELTAFKACGVSLYRLAAPILAVSFLLSGLLFTLDYYYLPETNRRQDAIRDEIKGRPVSTYLRPDRQWTAGQGDRIFYHLYFDSANKVLAGINLYDFDPKTFQLRRHISAERARWDEARSAWVFENGWVRGIEDARVPVYYETFTARSFPDLQEDPAYFMKEDRQHQQMNWEELRAYILDLTQSGFDTIRLQVQLHKKLAFPLFAFVMAVLAVPFSLLAGHRGALTGVVLGIALAIAYYALNALFEQMGRANQLTPEIAAWAPSLIFGLSGAYLFVRVRS